MLRRNILKSHVFEEREIFFDCKTVDAIIHHLGVSEAQKWLLDCNQTYDLDKTTSMNDLINRLLTICSISEPLNDYLVMDLILNGFYFMRHWLTLQEYFKCYSCGLCLKDMHLFPLELDLIHLHLFEKPECVYAKLVFQVLFDCNEADQ